MSATEIVLQPLSADDNKHLYELFGDNKVLKSYAISPLSSTKQRDDIIRRITAKGCWTWKIQEVEKEYSFLGICSLHHYNKSKQSIEIGGTLFSNYWGKGIMFDAFEKLIKKAQQDFYIKQLIGKTRSSNQKAIKLARKLGFSVLSSNEEETILLKDLFQ